MLDGPSSRKIYIYQFLTLGFYYFYWCSRSRRDINQAAGSELIPSTWLLAVPAGNYWWLWRYANALETVSFGRIKASDTFGLYLIGTFFVLGLTSFLRWLPTPPSKTASSISLHTLIVGVIVYIVVLALLGIAGLGFFCATMQKKITAIAHPQQQ